MLSIKKAYSRFIVGLLGLRKTSHGLQHTKLAQGVYEDPSGIRLLMTEDVAAEFEQNKNVPLSIMAIPILAPGNKGRKANSYLERSLRMTSNHFLLCMFQRAKAAGESDPEVLAWFDVHYPEIPISSRLDEARKSIPEWTDFQTAREANKLIRKIVRNSDAGHWNDYLDDNTSIIKALELGRKRASEYQRAINNLSRDHIRNKSGPGPREERILIGDSLPEPTVDQLIFIAAFANVDPTLLWPQFYQYHSQRLQAIARLCQLFRKKQTILNAWQIRCLKKICFAEDLDSPLPVEQREFYQVCVQRFVAATIGEQKLVDITIKVKKARSKKEIIITL